MVSSDHDLTIHSTMYHSEIGTMGKLLNVDENEEIQLAAKNLYVYVFHHTNTLDMRGNINYFGGAQHSSDLLFLFGPTMFKQISRRRLSQTEEKLCRKLHQLFGDFVKTGNPKPGYPAESWQPYSSNSKYIKIIGTNIDGLLHSRILKDAFFDENRKQIEKMMDTEDEDRSLGQISASSTLSRDMNPYHLSNVNNGFEENERVPRNFAIQNSSSTKHEEYYFYLRRIHSFWYEFLPSLNRNHDDESVKISESYTKGELNKNFFFQFFS